MFLNLSLKFQLTAKTCQTIVATSRFVQFQFVQRSAWKVYSILSLVFFGCALHVAYELGFTNTSGCIGLALAGVTSYYQVRVSEKQKEWQVGFPLFNESLVTPTAL